MPSNRNMWIGMPDQTDVNQYGGYRPSQPSQKYPFRPVAPPRVDNKNQPWYGGPRWWGADPGTNNANDIVTTPNPNTLAVQNLSSIWDIINSWFGGATPKQNLLNTGNQGTPIGSDQTSPTSGMTSSTDGGMPSNFGSANMLGVNQ